MRMPKSGHSPRESRMREYLYELTHHEGLETVVLPVGDGVTVSYVTRS